MDNREKVFFVSALIVFLLGGLLWYNYVHRPPVFSPRNLFQQTFEESPDSVTDLEGGNHINLGFDYWIRFKSSIPVHLRDAKEFKPYVAEVGRNWFADKWKDERSLHDTASSYEYLTRSRYGVGHVSHDGLLINKKQKSYFYRNWGM